MAITVIKKGKQQEVECPKCGALLGYGKGDIEIWAMTAQGSTVSYSAFIFCPECAQKVEVNNGERRK